MKEIVALTKEEMHKKGYAKLFSSVYYLLQKFGNSSDKEDELFWSRLCLESDFIYDEFKKGELKDLSLKMLTIILGHIEAKS